MRKYLPNWLIAVVVVIVVIIILAIIIGALGGFNWQVIIGHFHWDIGVTKGG